MGFRLSAEYRDVEQQGDELFVGNIHVGRVLGKYTAEFTREAQEALSLIWCASLIRCNCGQWFIGRFIEPRSHLCARCRKGRGRFIRRAYIEARSEARAEARACQCEQCGKPMTAERSTRRFCSARCRQAHRRGPEKPPPLDRAVRERAVAVALREKSAVIKDRRTPDIVRLKRVLLAKARHIRRLKKTGLTPKGYGVVASATKLLIMKGKEVTPEAISDLVGGARISVENAAAGLALLRVERHYKRIACEALAQAADGKPA